MNIEQKPFEFGCFSLRETTDKKEIIHQNSTTIHKHIVKKGYQILSKNDFGKVKKRINVGIFNKKTNFVVGEKNSLIFWDNKNLELISKDISEILEEPSRYFMIYDMSFMSNFDNLKLKITDKKTNESTEFILDKNFGKDIGSFLRIFEPGATIIPDEFSILKPLIKIENDKLSINKQVLVNSNPDFLIGILEGYLGNSKHFQLKRNINIYNFTYILNLLCAQYSIRTTENNEKHIRFKLPIFFKGVTDLNDVYFRKYKYIFENNELILKKDIISLVPEVEEPDFFKMVNTGLIEMIPVKDLVFIPLEEETVMYDLTMPDANATNYSLPGLPLAKNSDGDVLGVVAIHTRDAANECIRKFSTELKENFLNLGTGDVNNWGVKLDSQMALYVATK